MEEPNDVLSFKDTLQEILSYLSYEDRAHLARTSRTFAEAYNNLLKPIFSKRDLKLAGLQGRTPDIIQFCSSATESLEWSAWPRAFRYVCRGGHKKLMILIRMKGRVYDSSTGIQEACRGNH